jgi:uncharacterized membrane protein
MHVPVMLPATSRFFRPEYVYPALLLLWGTLLALLLPLVQCPDEGSHAFRSFHLSRGRIHPDGILDGWVCGRAPESLHDLLAIMYYRTMLQHPQRGLSADEFRHFSSVSLKTDPEREAGFTFLSYTCFVPYVPQALGIAVARELGGSLLVGFYAGRLANLLVCVLVLHLALRLLPFYKNVLGVVALLPVSVQQMATLSADALGIASCFLFTALMFRIIVPTDRRPGVFTLLALCATALLLPLCKLPYALLTLLYLGVSPARLGSWRKYLLVGAALAAITLVGAYVTVRSSRGAWRLGEGSPQAEVSRSRQVAHLRQHPFRFARVLARTSVCWGGFYCDHLTTLGWLNVPLNHVPAKAYVLFLALMALVDRRRGWVPGLRLRLAALALCLLAYVLFQLMLYLVWTPVAAPMVEGFQGRYFLGFLPVLVLFFYSRVVAIRARPGVLLALGAAAAIAVQLATQHAILRVYYFSAQPGETGTSTPMVILAGGLIFLASLVFVTRRVEWAEPLEERRDRGDQIGAAGTEAGATSRAA